ncbi:apolipoprotein N-acyltransferase [soil metagenome]
MIAPLLSALLLALATMVPGCAPLTLVALAPLFSALSPHPWFATKKRFGGWKTGYLFGLFYGFAQLAWIFSLTAKWTASVPLALIPYLLATVLFALHFGLFGWLAGKLFLNGRPWAIPLLWAGVEVFRSYIPIFAFPWGLLATPWHIWPTAMASAGVGTIYLTGGLIALFNLALVQRWKWALVGIPLSVFIWPFLGWPTGPRRAVSVAVIQPGVDMAFGDDQTLGFRLGRAINLAIGESGSPDLIVLPEGVARGGSSLPPQAPFAFPSSPVLFGGQRGSGPFFQSAYAWDGRVWRAIDKTRLVIFGEFVPGRDLLPFLQAFRLPTGDLTAGTGGVRSLPFPKMRVGPVLCFEALFPDISGRMGADGAQMLAIMSIDDWFMGTAAPDQLQSAAAWRAVETGLPTVRAASTGRSLILTSAGRVVSDGGYGYGEVLRATLEIPDHARSPWLLALFPSVAVLSGLVMPWLPRRPRGSPDTPESDPTPEPVGPL